MTRAEAEREISALLECIPMSERQIAARDILLKDTSFDGTRMRYAKHAFMRIASKYPASPESIPLILADPEWRREFPQSAAVGEDRIALDVIDIIPGTPVIAPLDED